MRESKPTANPVNRAKAAVDVVVHGAVAVVNVNGLVDEHFSGLGTFPNTIKSLVIHAAGITRMTSFGVRQWLKGMDALPKSITDLYLLSCPTFFVDQLNMVLNFGGSAQILSVVAPYNCPSCGQDSSEMVDVLAERAALIKGGVPEKQCSRCGAKLEFDETPESYFSFVNKYAASTIEPNTAQVLAQIGLYTATIEAASEKPPRIIKLVRGAVTYFRINGTIGSMFRARPFLMGAEGEIVIDLAEVDRFDPAGQREWRRLLKTLTNQVAAVTIVDVNDTFLTTVGDGLALMQNVSVWSVLLPYTCIDCGRTTQRSQPLHLVTSWPPQFEDGVCTTCGGQTRNDLPSEMLAPLQHAKRRTPPASAKLIEQRDEVLSRELTDAAVAQAGESATPSLGSDDTILGKYKIVRRLSQGGMAEVFLAKQVGIGGFEKPVALKRIQRQLLESRHLAIDMFLNEAKIAGRLMHPNIVQVLDVAEVGGALYLAMEYVRGKDLREVVKRLRSVGAAMPIGEASFIVREVAQALHHAYWSTDMAGNRLNVVHRDVSPHNIILSYEGAVKLLDFGVAMSSVTDQADMVVGKWQYMSPEHTTPQKLDHRSDLFSLGVILYLLCTGSLPFTDSNHREIVRKVRAGQYKPMHVVAPGVPQQLSALVAGLLSPDPNDRPQTGQEVAAILTEIARGYGYERSTSDMVRFLAENFPDEQGDSTRVSVQSIRQAGVVPLSPGTSSINPSSGSNSGSLPFATTSAQPAARSSRPQTVDSVATVAQVPPPPRQGAAPQRHPEHPNIPKLTSGRWPLFPLVIILAITVAVFVYFLLTS